MVELLVAEDGQTSLELGELVRMAVEEVSRGTKWSSIESTGVERPLSTGTNLKRSLGGWSAVGREQPIHPQTKVKLQSSRSRCTGGWPVMAICCRLDPLGECPLSGRWAEG